MSEVHGLNSEALPKNIDGILSTPNTFLIYLKTMMAGFAQVLTRYEEAAKDTDRVETEVVQELFRIAEDLKRKPVLVEDPSATDEEVQRVFEYTREEFAAMKLFLEDFNFEGLREDKADCYVTLETFATEFEEKMVAVIVKLRMRLNEVSIDYLGDGWLEDERTDCLIHFLEQILVEGEDSDPEVEQYKKVMDYFGFSSFCTVVGALCGELKEKKEELRLGITMEHKTDVVIQLVDEFFDRYGDDGNDEEGG